MEIYRHGSYRYHGRTTIMPRNEARVQGIVFGPDMMPEVEFSAWEVTIGCLPGCYNVYASLSLADLKTMIAMFVAHLRLHPNNATKAHAGLKDVSADLTYLANLAQGYVPGDFPDEDESGVAA